MKTTMKILSSVIMTLLLMVSCQKEQIEYDLSSEKNQEEGFTSKTGKNDSEIESVSKEGVKQLIHKRYDASLSRKKAEALFLAEVNKYEKEFGQVNRASSFLTFTVSTTTGDLPYSQTEGRVWARVYFLTDKGHHPLSWFPLNNEGDDRQNGAWDFYYMGAHVPSISWVEVTGGSLALQGTDGWYAKYFDVRVLPYRQYSSATGSTRFLSDPETWLDNTTSSGWDYYSTGRTGYGRLTFN